MAYGEWAGSIAPWPGAARRDALLELLSTPGLSTDITAPFYSQFMQDRALAQESRQDYLSQALQTAITGATQNQSARQTQMLMDAVQSAYGVKPESRLADQTAATFATLYPERRNELKTMPGGVSPLSQTAPIGYEDMLALNKEVKLGVEQGKSLQDITNDAVERVRGYYTNPNYSADTAQLTGEQQFTLPENWAAIEGQMRTIINRAYEKFSGETPATATTATNQPVSTAEPASVLQQIEDWLKPLSIAGGVGYGAYRAGKSLLGKLPETWGQAPWRAAPQAAEQVARTPIGELPALGQSSYRAPAPSGGTTRPTNVGVTRYFEAPGMGRTTPYYEPETRLGPPPATNAPGLRGFNARMAEVGNLPSEMTSSSLIGMVPIAISEMAANKAFGDLPQAALIDQLREQSVAIDPQDAQMLQNIGVKVWQDPTDGQLYAYLPIGQA